MQLATFNDFVALRSHVVAQPHMVFRLGVGERFSLSVEGGRIIARDAFAHPTHAKPAELEWDGTRAMFHSSSAKASHPVAKVEVYSRRRPTPLLGEFAPLPLRITIAPYGEDPIDVSDVFDVHTVEWGYILYPSPALKAVQDGEDVSGLYRDGFKVYSYYGVVDDAGEWMTQRGFSVRVKKVEAWVGA